MAQGNLSLEELIEEGYKRIARDRARLSGTNYPAYRGNMIAPMSDLTQRARGLQEKFSSKAAPFSKKIERVLNRKSAGIGEDDIARQLEFIKQGQQGYSQNNILGKLQKRFGASYDQNRAAGFSQKLGKDTERGLAELGSNLRNIGDLSANLDRTRNQQTAKMLQEMQAQKQMRRGDLVSSLQQFGNQKHALANMKSQAARNQFDQEVNSPYRKIDSLQQMLDTMSRGMEGGIHPDLEQSKFQELQKAIGLYDGTKGPYTGQLIADATPEMEVSQQLLGNLNPNFRDSMYDKRKSTVKNLVGKDSVSKAVLEQLPENIKASVGQLEYAGKKRLKQDLSGLAQKYIKLGQHNSPQHIKSAEERAREINQAMLEQRNRLLESTLKNDLTQQHQSDIGMLKDLDIQGLQGQREFGDVMGNIRSLNQLGTTKWKNNQADNEELYKNYSNEASWELPHMRRMAEQRGKQGAFADIFSGMQERNISLENLANLNTNYSEMEKERDRYRGELDTEKKRYQGQLDSMQKIIDTQKREMALAQARAQEEARARATRQAEENARYAERQRQEAEAARLRQIQEQQEKMRQQAQAQAQNNLERQRVELWRTALSGPDGQRRNWSIDRLPTRAQALDGRFLGGQWDYLDVPFLQKHGLI
jgi:septum formation inhibitor MinC